MSSVTVTRELTLGGDRPDGSLTPRSRWIFGLVTLALLTLAFLFAADRLFHPEKFQIQEIEVRGEFKRVSGEQIKEVIEQSLTGNYFSMNLSGLESRVNALPWVFSASLRRQWPATLVVDVVEAQPVAKWGEGQWLNFSGDLVAGRPESIERNLPELHGPDSQRLIVWRAFQKWSGMLVSNGLSLDALRLDARGLWYLEITLSALALNRDPSAADGMIESVTVIVDREHADERVRRFMQALNQKLIAEFAAMRTVDLRYPNGFTVSWKSPLSDPPNPAEIQQ